MRVVHSNDLNRFVKLYQQTAKRQKFCFRKRFTFALGNIFNEGRAFILIAQWNETDIAGCLILHHDKTAYYYHAASLSTWSRILRLTYWSGKQSLIQALNLKELIWE